MGTVIKPGEIKAMASSMITSLHTKNDSLNRVIPHIKAIKGNTSLAGKAWESAKTQLGYHVSIIEGIVCGNESMIQDSQTLIQKVGNEDLIEEDIRETIKTQEALIENWQRTATSYRRKAGGSGILLWSKGYHLGMATYYEGLISNANSIITIQKGKLDQIANIIEATSSLFSDCGEAYTTAGTAMSAIGSTWNGSGFDLPASLDWLVDLEGIIWNSKAREAADVVRGMKLAAGNGDRAEMIRLLEELGEYQEYLAPEAVKQLDSILDSMKHGYTDVELKEACNGIFESQLIYEYSRSKSFRSDDALENPCLSNAKNELAFLTQLKGTKSVEDAIALLSTYDYVIFSASYEFGVDKNMIQAVIFRETICFGVDDNIADTIYNVFGKESSTGIAQIKPQTAINAEMALGISTETSLDDMWKRLQDPQENVRSAAMILKHNESLIDRYSAPVKEAHTTEELILSRYNGIGDASIEYGVATYQYYLAFQELER